MIKIELTDKTKNLHEKYFEDYILLKIRNASIKFIQQDLDEFNKKRNESYELNVIKDKHDEFINLCLSKWNILATGNVKELKAFQCEVSDEIKNLITKNFTLYKRNSKKKIRKNGKHKTYGNLLLDMFGYKEFVGCNLIDTIVEYGENFGREKAFTDKKPYKRKDYEQVIHDNMIALLISIFPEKVSELSLKLKSKKSIDNFKKELKTLNLQITLNNYSSKAFLGIWNAYTFVLSSGVRVCPYCNRSYITPIYTTMSQARGELDHFFPKSKYPYFSMSAHNLVPVCHQCNSSLKWTSEFLLDDLNPYEENFDDYAKFSALIESDKPVNISIERTHSKVENYVKMFELELQYNYHINQVEELINKRFAYSETFIKDLMKDRFENSEIIEDNLKEILIGYTRKSAKINNEPLSKFRRDIVEQLKFFDDSDTSLIDKLKKKYKIK